jgi:pentatricopeptide repeat-containing protein PET309
LGLPTPWYSPLSQRESDGNLDTHSNNARGSASQSIPGGLLLDFLYPLKTLALIKSLSGHDWDAGDRRRKCKFGASTIRNFSSTSRNEVILGDVDMEEAELQRMVSDASADSALRKLLESREPGKQDLAWRLYEHVDQANHASSLHADLLDYLESSQEHWPNPSRLLRVFNAISKDDLRDSSYRAAISAYLALGMVGPAVKLHDEAAYNCADSEFGTDVLLARVIQDNQWELTIRVYGAFMEFWGSECLDEHIPKLWTAVKALPTLQSNTTSLLEYIRQYDMELQAATEKHKILSGFLKGFIPIVIETAISEPEPREDFIRELFSGLRDMGFSNPSYYELAILKLLSLPRYRNYLNQPKLFLDLYRNFREEALERSDPSFQPSKKAIERLISQMGRHGSFTATKGGLTSVSELIEDWCRWHGALPAHMLYLLMNLYADIGNAAKVHEYFEAIRTQERQPITLRHLNQLLYVYARRIDVSGVLKQFQRISEEFGLVPGIDSWNILIYAYVRADDLDGALSCFRDVMTSDVKPDGYTFGPLLDLCAKRGDVESVQMLLSQAASLDVHVHDRAVSQAALVLAYLNAYDMVGAERAALELLIETPATVRPVDLTLIWNMLITHHALLGDVESSRRLYRQMVENNIPLDSWTYAALMRSLIELRQTNAAYKILRVTMPNNNVRVYAFHYALVMSGFASEGQLHRAMHAYKRMKERNVKPSIASRLASIQAVGLSEIKGLKQKHDKDPLTRLVEVEESIREILAEGDAAEFAMRQPRHRRSNFFNPLERATPEGYFGFLILLYGIRGAYSVCKELFEAATSRSQDTEDNYEAPLGLLSAIMEAHLAAREYGEVERCWKLARAQADNMVKTWQMATHPSASATVEMDSLLDPSARGEPTAKVIALNRRHILQRPTRIYLRSLFAQGNATVTRKAQNVMSDLLAHGYMIDSVMWNEFIRMLARSGQMVDAFTACEAYLMPNFFGWRNLYAGPRYRRRDLAGFSYMDVRKADLRKGLLMPHYFTLVVMAAAYSHVKRQESVGIRSNNGVSNQDWMTDILQKIAPKTIRAIESMPVVPDDPLQREYLMGM